MNEERNLEDIGSDLAARSYEPIQTIGRGAFGEVIIARASSRK